VSAIPDSFYAEFRVRCGAVQVLREDQDSPPERLVQAIWQHQRLLREELRTAEGQPVKVLHPGFLSREGGPDFRAAVVQVGEGPVQSGDVEVDLRASGWRAHGHDRNPAFRNVILHVIWENERPAAGAPPLLPLRQWLDAPLGELSLWLGGEATQGLPEELRGKCCAPLRNLAAAEVLELLHQAAAVRLRSKAAQFQARARQAGWDQALWEGLFRALGYKHNIWPMQRLAELRPRWWSAETHRETPGTIPQQEQAPRTRYASRHPDEVSQVLMIQARLLGLSGLLPAEITRTETGADGYLRQVWDLWWRERDGFLENILPRAVWHLHGLRPANHPQRRLALAAGWTVVGDIPGRLEQWCARELRQSSLLGSLVQALQVQGDEFWCWHWTLRSTRLKKQQPLLGSNRVTELAMNVVLPWLWMRAVEGKNQAVQQRLEQRYFTWPAAEDNAVLRLARQRLLGGANRRELPGAAAQQGLIQMVRDFCDHSNSICDNCKLPELVKEWRRQKPGTNA
jgi:hypothetical protein